MAEIPKRIYLQPHMAPDVTWCVDQIDETDVEYVRADVAEARIALLRDCLGGLIGALERCGCGGDVLPITGGVVCMKSGSLAVDCSLAAFEEGVRPDEDPQAEVDRLAEELAAAHRLLRRHLPPSKGD